MGLFRTVIASSILALFYALPTSVAALPDIVFITQPPYPNDFATVNATFGSHRASLDSVPRGGDLYLRYSEGTLKNLTAAAGYGRSGFQGAQGIAVRDPAVHWSGSKIIFSMVIGSPVSQYQVESYRWQLYEVSKLGAAETPQITKLANQPTSYNNVMPVYGTDDRIIFVSDRPQGGQAHTYPQRDEYESTATNSGLWSLNPTNGDLIHLDHAPSGDFSPTIDSFGRVIFTRWDHLQRDQQNRCSNQGFGAFNYASEQANAAALDSDLEVYPEQRAQCDATRSDNIENHSFNHFLPWQMNEDGTDMETINHIGRHELASYIPKTFRGDANIEEFYGQYTRVNKQSVANFFQLQEDPTTPGTYVGISAAEFGTHASGQIVKMSAPPSKPADQIAVIAVTHPDTSGPDSTPSVGHSGFSRDPAFLSDGSLIASHTLTTVEDSNVGSSTAPVSKYNFRIKSFVASGQYNIPDAPITSGISKTISFWSPDVLVSYNNVTMWELQPREIRIRTTPARLHASLPAPEGAVFQQQGVDVADLRAYLNENNLALIISRNVTSRDNLDHQQPLNLQVEGSTTKTIKNDGKLYSVAHLQIFEGDLIRGYGGLSNPQAGRRVIAQPLHSVSQNPENPGAPTGSVKIAADGSLAAFVPARRALTYQLTNSAGQGVVRERLWLTFQPGEIRVCGSCHGVNSIDQKGADAPTNQPEALRQLLDYWKGIPRQDPVMSLELAPLPKNKSTALIGGSKLSVIIKGGNSRAAQRAVVLSLSLGKQNCGTIAEFTTDADGDYQLRSKKLPLLSKKAQLSFSIATSGAELDKKSIVLSAVRGGKVRSTGVCGAIKKAFR